MSRAELEVVVTIARSLDGESPISLPEDSMAVDQDPYADYEHPDNLPEKVREARGGWYSPGDALIGFRNSAGYAVRPHILNIDEANTEIWKFSCVDLEIVDSQDDTPPDCPEGKGAQLMWWLDISEGEDPQTGAPCFDVLMHHFQVFDDIPSLKVGMDLKVLKKLALAEFTYYRKVIDCSLDAISHTVAWKRVIGSKMKYGMCRLSWKIRSNS